MRRGSKRYERELGVAIDDEMAERHESTGTLPDGRAYLIKAKQSHDGRGYGNYTGWGTSLYVEGYFIRGGHLRGGTPAEAIEKQLREGLAELFASAEATHG